MKSREQPLVWDHGRSETKRTLRPFDWEGNYQTHLERLHQSKRLDCNILQSYITSVGPLHDTAASMMSALHTYA